MIDKKTITLDLGLFLKIPTVAHIVLVELENTVSQVGTVKVENFKKQILERLNYGEQFYAKSVEALSASGLVSEVDGNLILNNEKLAEFENTRAEPLDISSYHEKEVVFEQIFPAIGPIMMPSGRKVSARDLVEIFGFEEEAANSYAINSDNLEFELIDIFADAMKQKRTTAKSTLPKESVVKPEVSENQEVSIDAVVNQPVKKEEPSDDVKANSFIAESTANVVVNPPANTAMVIGGPFGSTQANPFAPAQNEAVATVQVVQNAVTVVPNEPISAIEAFEPEKKTNFETAIDGVANAAVDSGAEVTKVEKETKKTKKETKKTIPIPPNSLQEVYEWAEGYFNKNVLAAGDNRFTLEDYLHKAEQAYKYYEPSGWYDSDNNPILNFKLKISKVYFSSMTKAPFGWKPLDFKSRAEIAKESGTEGIMSVRSKKIISEMTLSELREFAECPDADVFGKQRALQLLEDLKTHKNVDMMDFVHNRLDTTKLTRLRIEQLLEWSKTDGCTAEERVRLEQLFSI